MDIFLFIKSIDLQHAKKQHKFEHKKNILIGYVIACIEEALAICSC